MPDAPTDPTLSPDPGVLCMELEGRPLRIQIRREGLLRSPHTGRDLRELHGWITTREQATHEWLAGALHVLAERSTRASDAAGDFAGRWLVSWNSYAEAAGVHTYSLILREEEELSLEALLLGGVELHPYEYRERVLGEGLTLWAKLVGNRRGPGAAARPGGRPRALPGDPPRHPRRSAADAARGRRVVGLRGPRQVPPRTGGARRGGRRPPRAAAHGARERPRRPRLLHELRRAAGGPAGPRGRWSRRARSTPRATPPPPLPAWSATTSGGWAPTSTTSEGLLASGFSL